MIDVQQKKLCSGCSACMNVCPKKCIRMVSDEEGFLYPVVDKTKCVNCGLCEKICPVLNKKRSKTNNSKAFACFNKDLDVRMKSSSGGIFSLLAKYILSNNGVVFGASFNDNFEVEHIAIDKSEDLHKLRTSKYVQSKIGQTYSEAKKFLDEDRLVLFTGTPCQIEGLLNYLGKDYENLLTQDIVCHGVPSPLVWKKYLLYQKEKFGADIKNISFRYKNKKAMPYFVRFVFDNEKIYQKKYYKDFMMKAFLKHLCLRPACHQCAFKDKNRRSDITLADFWGVNFIAPRINDGRGISLVLIHSQKGELMFEKIAENIEKLEVDFEKSIKHNPSMTTSTKPSKKREKFMEELQLLEFKDLIKKYGRGIF